MKKTIKFIALIFAAALFTAGGSTAVADNIDSTSFPKTTMISLRNAAAGNEKTPVKTENADKYLSKALEYLSDEINKLTKDMEPETKRAYLTFDDNVSANTVKILDILKEYNVKATFFITGTADEAVIKRMVDEGHSIGNHTYSHRYSDIYSSSEAFWDDFEKEQQYLENASGIEIKLVRFPGGSNNTVSRRYGGDDIMKTLIAEVEEKGYIFYDWNVSAQDSAGARTKGQIVSNVLNGAKKVENAVILMHHNSTKGNTAAALPEIITGLQKQGYTLLPIKEHSYLKQFGK